MLSLLGCIRPDFAFFGRDGEDGIWTEFHGKLHCPLVLDPEVAF